MYFVHLVFTLRIPHHHHSSNLWLTLNLILRRYPPTNTPTNIQRSLPRVCQLENTTLICKITCSGSQNKSISFLDYLSFKHISVFPSIKCGWWLYLARNIAVRINWKYKHLIDQGIPRIIIIFTYYLHNWIQAFSE